MENGEHRVFLREAQFLQLVSMFQVAALQQMGKLANPVTNQIERDLQQAKASIDIVEMLQEKTKGNLSDRETEYVDKVLFELRMNYVDEADKETKDKENGGKADGDEKKEDVAGSENVAEETGDDPKSEEKSAEEPESDAESPEKDG